MGAVVAAQPQTGYVNLVDSDETHPAAAALRMSVATPPRQGQPIVDAVIERMMAIHRIGGVLVYEASHGGILMAAGDLRVELWRSGHWTAQQRRRTQATSATLPHGGEWLHWVADRIDDEAKNGRLRFAPFR